MNKLQGNDEAYKALLQVLQDAYTQASAGKGKERHANERKFLEQPIFSISATHGPGFLGGQASKKLAEAVGIVQLKGPEAAYQECLGAIVYAAALAIKLRDGL